MSWLEYADIAPCGRCGKDVVLDHDPPQPCGSIRCPECPACDCSECEVHWRD